MSLLMERSAHIQCLKCAGTMRVSIFVNTAEADVTSAEFNARACGQLERNGWQQQPNDAWLCPAHLSEPPAVAGG